MFITGSSGHPTPKPAMKGTVWHCEKCSSFITIHSARIVQDLSCPVCLNELEFCTAFDGGFVPSAGEA